VLVQPHLTRSRIYHNLVPVGICQHWKPRPAQCHKDLRKLWIADRAEGLLIQMAQEVQPVQAMLPDLTPARELDFAEGLGIDLVCRPPEREPVRVPSQDIPELLGPSNIKHLLRLDCFITSKRLVGSEFLSDSECIEVRTDPIDHNMHPHENVSPSSGELKWLDAGAALIERQLLHQQLPFEPIARTPLERTDTMQLSRLQQR
jgi:hypothetical protein